MLTITSARTPADFDAFRELVLEFIDWALASFHPNPDDAPAAISKVKEELATLPGKYAEPDGVLFLAMVNNKPVGCLAGFRHDHQSIEVTRLWVRPEGRGLGVGRELVRHFLKQAKTNGYERAVLRSHQELKAAHKIYRNAGFTAIEGHASFPGFENIEIAMDRQLP